MGLSDGLCDEIWRPTPQVKGATGLPLLARTICLHAGCHREGSGPDSRRGVHRAAAVMKWQAYPDPENAVFSRKVRPPERVRCRLVGIVTPTRTPFYGRTRREIPGSPRSCAMPSKSARQSPSVARISRSAQVAYFPFPPHERSRPQCNCERRTPQDLVLLHC
jgi:hypothetical protein